MAEGKNNALYITKDSFWIQSTHILNDVPFYQLILHRSLVYGKWDTLYMVKLHLSTQSAFYNMPKLADSGIRYAVAQQV